MRWKASLIAPAALAVLGPQPALGPLLRAPAPADEAPWPEKLGKPYAVAGVTYAPRDQAGYTARGYASYYGDELAGRPTANGERFDPEALTAAHRTLPMPSWLEVKAMASGRTIVVRVNDRGPFAHDRLIDLSKGAARELGISGDGHMAVSVRRVALDPAQIAAFRKDERERAARRAALVQDAAMPPADGTGRHFVQLGSFAGAVRAAKLAEHSGAAVIEAGGLRRVRFGPFAAEATAREALRAAHLRGYPEARIIQD